MERILLYYELGALGAAGTGRTINGWQMNEVDSTQLPDSVRG
jgi:hypothetical protein